jgi:hypothetical protein
MGEHFAKMEVHSLFSMTSNNRRKSVAVKMGFEKELLSLLLFEVFFLFLRRNVALIFSLLLRDTFCFS